MIVRAIRRSLAMIPALMASGCVDWQSALDPHGPQALDVFTLLVIFVATCGIIWLLVVLALGLSMRGNARVPVAPLEANAPGERRAAIIVSVCVGLTVAVIAALTFASYATTRGLDEADPQALRIRLRGWQWWWEATYLDDRPDRTFNVANEIHVPVGRPVRIILEAPDVIHSFWVPSLAGKLDLIPGRSNEITIRADRAGIYRGQCAEFCGLQHAHMSFFVIADQAPDFERWRDAQLKPAVAAADAEAQRGREIFENKPCAACHTVRGINAAGTLGPDLTHVASRTTIAAGMLPTTRGSLAAWIADPQTIKPGNNMPMVSLSAEELRALAAYMSSLE